MNLENLKNVAKAGHLYGLTLLHCTDGYFRIAYSMDYPSKQWYKLNNRNGNVKFKSLKEAYRTLNTIVMNCPRTHIPTVYLSQILLDEVSNDASKNESETEQTQLQLWDNPQQT